MTPATPAPAARRPDNRRLAHLMGEAFRSRKSFARAVHHVAAELGTPIACDHVAVSRWLHGTTPRPATAHAITVTLGRALGRPVTLADIGLEPTPTDRPASAEQRATTMTQDWPADYHALRRHLDWLAEEIASVSRMLVTLGPPPTVPGLSGRGPADLVGAAR